MTSNHEKRQALIEAAKNKSIVEVAELLDMKLVKTGSSYYWDEHDSFIINPKKNMYYWNSMGFGGGPIDMVMKIKECGFKEAINLLTGNDLKIFDQNALNTSSKFQYFFKEHRNQNLAINYLTKERCLSAETVNFFISKGVIAQTTYKDPKTLKTEPVIVFKSLNRTGDIDGVALQGIWQRKGEKRPYLKRTLGEGYHALNVRIGDTFDPNLASESNPLKIIVFEAPIDMMSYYELFKNQLENVTLLTLNGLTQEKIANFVADRLGWITEDKGNTLHLIDSYSKTPGMVELTIATDNDTASKRFINEDLNFKRLPIKAELPKLLPGTDKSDWNEILQSIKKKGITKFESRVEKAVQEKNLMPNSFIPINPVKSLK